MSTKNRILELLEQQRGESISGEHLAGVLGISRNAVWKAIKELQKDGYNIVAVTNKGYCLSAENDIISIPGIKPFLSERSQFYANKIQVHKSLESTNKTAKEMKKNYKTIDLVYIALGAVLITICSWISIPTTVPFTMQTFAVFFVLSILGGKRGTVAIIVYVLLGAVGVPVFAQFTSGIGILFGNTGGYIVGFIFMGLVYWLIVHFLGKKLWGEILAMVIGLAVCYSFGTVWFMIVYAQANGAVGLAMVLAWCVIPFIIPDLIKLGLALTLARRLSPVLKLQ